MEEILSKRVGLTLEKKWVISIQKHKRLLKRFLSKTKALAICGYKMDVEWMKATAVELLVLSAMQDNVFNGNGINAIQKRIKRETR